MKRLRTILTILLILCLSSACGKKGDPIVLPDPTDISSIEINDGNSAAVAIDPEFIEEFVQLLASAEITNQQSIQDAPSADDYISILFRYEDSSSEVYFYQKKGTDYVEQPYQGIYKPGPELGEKITELFASVDGTHTSFTFQATVLEASDSQILAEPVPGSAELASADQFSLPNQDGLALQTGDLIEIEYNGGIMESYPAQLGEVYSIRVVTQE